MRELLPSRARIRYTVRRHITQLSLVSLKSASSCTGHDVAGYTIGSANSMVNIHTFSPSRVRTIASPKTVVLCNVLKALCVTHGLIRLFKPSRDLAVLVLIMEEPSSELMTAIEEASQHTVCSILANLPSSGRRWPLSAEPNPIRGFDSQKNCDTDTNIEVYLELATRNRLLQLLAQFDPTRSMMINLDSLDKDLDSSTSADEAVQRLTDINERINTHLQYLARNQNDPDQRLKASNSLASKNTKTYKRLSDTPKAIRLIVLLFSVSKHAVIKCILCNESLTNNSQYEALSYTWGDSAQTRDISVNGSSFVVTENLFVVFQHIRFRSSPRVLWIDAICINQNDVTEKNSQLQQMRDIYKQAFEVLIWLGPESNTAAEAIDFITFLPSYIIGLNPTESFPYDTPQKRSHMIDKMREVLLSDMYHEKGLAVSKFFERPWWERVWVSQEFAMASKAKFLCGSLVIKESVLEQFHWVWTYCIDLIVQIGTETGTTGRILCR